MEPVDEGNRYATIYTRYAASVVFILDEEKLFKQQLEELFANNYHTFRSRDDPSKLTQALKNLQDLNNEYKEQNMADICKSEIESIRSISLRQHHTNDIFALATQGDVIAVRNRIMEDKTLINRKMSGGISLLHIAAELGYYQLARFLLYHGADITSKNSKGKSPRELASGNGHICCKQLLAIPYFFFEAIVKKNNELKKFFRQEKILNTKVKLIFGMKEDVDTASFVNARILYAKKLLSPLINIAAEEINQEALELLLAQGANPNLIDGNGNTPLHIVILKSLTIRVNVTETVKKLERMAFLLLKKGAAVELQNHNGKSPLHLIKLQQSSQIYMMITKAKRVYDCVIDKKPDELKRLLEPEIIVTARFGTKGKSPLAQAIEQGDIESIKLLVNHQPDIIDIADDEGNQAIHLAILAKNFKLLEFLIEKGARIQDKNAHGKTPCDLGFDCSLLFFANTLMNDIFYLYDIHDKKVFFEDDKREIELKRILDKLQDSLKHEDLRRVIKVRSSLNKTLLHLFSEHQMIPLPFFQRIIELGVELNKCNFRGSNPIHNIARNRLIDSEELLNLFYDTFKNEVNECMKTADKQEKKTPPMIAAMNGNIQFIKWATKKNMIDFTAKDEHNQTILHLASASESTEATKTVAYLLELGCDPNVKDGHGNSSLLNAAQVGNIETIQILIAKGANILETDQKKRNLFHCLCRYGTFEQIFSFFKPENMVIMKSWPLKELFEAYDNGERDSPKSRFHELLAHNPNLKRKQSAELDKRGLQLLAMLKEQF